MPDRQHPEQHPFSPAGPPSAPSSGASGGPGGAPSDPFEQLLRTRLHQLAEHAPTTVHSLDELRVEHADRVAGRARARRDGRHRRSAGIGATIAALAGAVGITTVALSGAGTAGAASPEEAVRTFLAAAQAEDVFGMIDALDPAEVPAARSAAERGRADAVEADLVSEGFQLDGVDGVDLEFTDLTFTTEPVVDGVSVVTADGAVSLAFDPATFPLGSELAEALSGELEDASGSAELTDVVSPAMLATVERDGRWYVSTSFTLGEYARRSAGLEMPETPLTAVGSPTPEAAAERFWAGMLNLDAASVLPLAAPGEGDAVLAYGQLIVDAWDESVTELRDDEFVLQLDSVTQDVTGSGDRRRAEAIAFSVTGTLPSPPLYGFYDPTLPTVIDTWDARGIVVLDAGVEIPQTLEDFEVDPDYNYPPGELNYTAENADGTVQQLPPMPEDDGPDPITIERVDGCTTFSGEGAVNLLGGTVVTSMPDGTVTTETQEVTAPGFESVGDEAWRTCGDSVSGYSLLSLFGFGGLSELPAIEVVEVDGQWYVSPVGTVAEIVLDLIRTVRDGSLLDSPLAYNILGTDRAGLAGMLTGNRLVDLSEECQALAVVGADGRVTGAVEDPNLAQVRRCATGQVYSDEFIGMPPTEEPQIADDGTVTFETVPIDGATSSTEAVPSDVPMTDPPPVEIAPASTAP